MEGIQRLSQAYSQAPWRKQVRILGLFLLVVVLLALVISIYLNVTARASEIGRDIQVKQAEILDDEQLISDMKGKLGILSSAVEMERRARTLGFQNANPDDTLFVAAPGYAAHTTLEMAPVYQAQIASASVLPPQYTESVLVWLQKMFNQLVFPLFKVRQ